MLTAARRASTCLLRPRRPAYTASRTPRTTAARRRRRICGALCRCSRPRRDPRSRATSAITIRSPRSRTVHVGHYDEIIISTLDGRASRWMRLDLPRKARGLGLPVTHVEPEAVEACVLEVAAAAV